MSISEKLGKVIELEHQLAKSSSRMHTARARYTEYLEEKAIVTSDGANCSMQIAQPELSLSAIAEKDGQRATGGRGAGVSGGWKCLFNHPTLNHVVEDIAKTTVDLLDAKYPEGGRKKVILAPAVVGLLCHEAIGHTVEADFVKAGSIAAGKIGQMVASPLVTMADSGNESIAGYAVGNLPFDDEGIETENTVIIREGKLASYLHNRESAAEFGVAPTGNARAWLFSDEPLIRMRNTYIVPGQSKLADMIAGIDDGYLIEGAGSGQADSNGEFMFGCSHVYEIKNGKKTNLLREATLSGIAFDVLKTVDAVSSEFQWDLGTGHCGKGQPAKVDAGGPYIRRTPVMSSGQLKTETKDTISSLSKKLDSAARDTLSYAKKQSADRAKVSASCSVEKRLVVENKQFTLANTLESQKVAIGVHKDQKKGSASLNTSEQTGLRRSVDDALALAQFSVADEFLVMPDAKEAPKAKPLSFMWNDKMSEVSLSDLQEFTQAMLSRLTKDKRVALDRLEVSTSCMWHGLYNSLGMEQSETQTSLSWSFMGMAVDGDEVSGFDYDGRSVYSWDTALDIALKQCDEFAEKIVNCGDHLRGESFLI